MSTLMQERYGRRGIPRRGLLVAAAITLTLSVAFIGWVTAANQTPLTWDDIGFKVLSDAQIEVTFDASFTGSFADSGEADSDRPTAVCTIHAMNGLRTEVGLRDVQVQPGPGGRVRATVLLPTSERATTGLVKSCVRTAG